MCENKNFRSWEGFQECCRIYLKDERDKIPMLKQTLISLNNRIRRFSIGPMKAVFDSNSELTVSQLFNRKVILDLSSIIRLGGEKEDALFFLNMVLKYLWDRNLTRGAINYDGINHITIIEDAQYFAPTATITKSTGSGIVARFGYALVPSTWSRLRVIGNTSISDASKFINMELPSFL